MAYVKEICYLVLILVVSLKAQTGIGGNSLQVESTSGRTNTRRGCNESFVCQGIGEELVWRKLPARAILNNTNTRTITTELINGVLVSRLSFSPITERDGGTYSCIVTGENGRQRTQSVDVIVDADELEIVSEIENIDISTYTIGDVISISCTIGTCANEITVFLMKGEEDVKTGTRTSSDENSLLFVHNFDVDVSDDTAGTYACSVETVIPMLFEMRIFNITGTPILPPGATRPPTLPPGVTRSSTDTSGGSDATTDDDDSSVPLRINVILLSILLFLSLFLLLA